MKKLLVIVSVIGLFAASAQAQQAAAARQTVRAATQAGAGAGQTGTAAREGSKAVGKALNTGAATGAGAAAAVGSQAIADQLLGTAAGTANQSQINSDVRGVPATEEYPNCLYGASSTQMNNIMGMSRSGFLGVNCAAFGEEGIRGDALNNYANASESVVKALGGQHVAKVHPGRIVAAKIVFGESLGGGPEKTEEFCALGCGRGAACGN